MCCIEKSGSPNPGPQCKYLELSSPIRSAITWQIVKGAKFMAQCSFNSSAHNVGIISGDDKFALPVIEMFLFIVPSV